MDQGAFIERSTQLKRDLADFACSPRYAVRGTRYAAQLGRFMLEAGHLDRELSEGETIGVIDRFALAAADTTRPASTWRRPTPRSWQSDLAF